jgi:hypothetical protein
MSDDGRVYRRMLGVALPLDGDCGYMSLRRVVQSTLCWEKVGMSLLQVDSSGLRNNWN